MNDLRTEDDLRSALDLLGRHAPEITDLLRPLTPGTRRGRRTLRLAPLAVVLVVIAAVAGIAAVYEAHLERHPPHTAKPAIGYAIPPRGMRLASYGQVSILVPAGLPTRTSLCGRPVSNQVVAPDGGTYLCPVATNQLAAHPGTVVWFSAGRESSPYADIATSSSQIDGHPARRGYADHHRGLGDGVSAVVALPGRSVRVGITAPTRADVDRLLASVRIADDNPFGCAATLHAAATTPAGPSNALIPGQPTSVIRCVYGVTPNVGPLLIGSYAYGPSSTHRLTAALNQLIPDPCHCAHGGTFAPGRDEELYFRYPDHSLLRVTGSLGGNLDSYSNGSRMVANYSGSIGQLLTYLAARR